MTDKELLELAAKAAGYKSATDVDGMQFVIFEDGVWPVEWNPLTSDGDALRLEVTLKLSTDWDEESGTWGIYAPADLYRLHFLARHDDRKRATTMAAAELGRKLHDIL